MANTCFYDMRIRGNKDGASYLCSLFDESNSMENVPCIGRVYSADTYEKEETESELYFAISGDCAWSVLTAMLNMNRENTLENVIKQYKLNVECYSEEPGIGFMEHFVWKDGERVVDACEDFMECNVDDISGDEEDNDWFFDDENVIAYGITRENYTDYANEDGYIRVGGFEYNWQTKRLSED